MHLVSNAIVPAQFFLHWNRCQFAAVTSSVSGDVAPADSHPNRQCSTSGALLLLCDSVRFCGAESVKWHPLLRICSAFASLQKQEILHFYSNLGLFGVLELGFLGNSGGVLLDLFVV